MLDREKELPTKLKSVDQKYYKVFIVFNKSERNIPVQEFIERGFAINGDNDLIEIDKEYWATIDKKMEGFTN